MMSNLGTSLFFGYVTPIWIIVFAIFFYKMGVMEYKRGIVPCLLSIFVSLLAVILFKFGLKGLIFCQILLFCGFWGFNIYKEEKPKSFSDLKKSLRQKKSSNFVFN